MSRPPNNNNTVRITITTTKQVHGHLTSLIPLGLYGRNTAEVAERLLCEALRADLKRLRQTLLEKNAQPKDEEGA